MIIELTPTVILTFIAILISLTSLVYARMGDSRKLESRITSLETKIEPLWKIITTELPSLLIRESTPELDFLLMKLSSPDKSLKTDERINLLKHLDREYIDAIKEENTGHGVAIVFLRAAIKINGNQVSLNESK